jgi:hypothetical protein
VYEFILQNKAATLLAAIAVAWLAATLVGNPRVTLRSMGFNYGPAFACAFFLVSVFYDGQLSGFDLAAGFLFEFLVLLAYSKLFCDALKSVRGVDNRAVELWLRSSLALQLLVSLPLVMSEGFGIFSEGSRIAYLESSGAAKYLTYAGVLLAPVQAGLLAQRLSGGHSPGATGYAVIASTFALSTLSGSKGGIFLWLASTLALTDYRRLRIRWMPILAGLIAVAVALVVTANIISETLGISEIEFAELAISRFFLNNDARALAFDFGGASRQPSELVSASFRSLSTLFGHGSIDPPLGLLLYERYFGVSTGNGPNASLIALIAYYSMRGYAMFPALIACLGLAAAYGGVVAFRHIVHGPLRKMAVTVIGLTLVQQLSQDFLAFPLLVPLACAAGFLFIVTDRKYAGANPRRLNTPTQLAIPQHRHPGS